MHEKSSSSGSASVVSLMCKTVQDVDKKSNLLPARLTSNYATGAAHAGTFSVA